MFSRARDVARQFATEYWQEWLSRRIPLRREVCLNRHNLFIFPSKAGFVFLLLLLSLTLAAINYDNNLVFALTFLLASLFVVAIQHTHANLSGLTLRAGHSQPVFAGHDACFSLALKGGGRHCHDGLLIRWDDSDFVRAAIRANDEDMVQINIRAPARGWFKPERLLLQSWYPLGLVRSWSWVDLDTRCLVYPRPLPAALPPSLGRGDEGALLESHGGDDFTGLRDYRPGDSLRHVAWRTAARGGPLQTKEYGSFAEQQVWLDWDDMDRTDSVETRLSKLCYLALRLNAENTDFGLRLPSENIEAGTGPEHLESVLRALALAEIGA